MKIIPSIDVKNGYCVKLVQGKPGTGLKISPNPVEVAEYWFNRGAKLLHIVDLDGALKGVALNRQIVLEIAKRVNIPVQVGGGIRTVKDALELMEAGVSRIVLGTIVYENPELFRRIVDAVNADRVIVALDVKSGFVVKRGWTEIAGITVYDALRLLDPAMFWGILYTDVNRDGLASGVDLETVKRLLKVAGKPVLYAGGVSSLSEIAALRDIGVYGVIVGRALYAGLFSLRAAMEVAQDV